jgi:hypothetical protein
MKRDITGKFALKNEEHRLVRSLRLTDSTWESLEHRFSIHKIPGWARQGRGGRHGR